MMMAKKKERENVALPRAEAARNKALRQEVEVRCTADRGRRG